MTTSDFRRKLYSGYADSMTRAFELVVAPLVFGLVGFALDRTFGLTPILTIITVVVAFAGTGVKLWYGYDLEMQRHDAGAPWAAGTSDAPRPATPTATPTALPTPAPANRP